MSFFARARCYPDSDSRARPLAVIDSAGISGGVAYIHRTKAELFNRRTSDKLSMDAPDFSKYDETQLTQILRRIDRERFPERAKEIEALLEAFRPASSKIEGHPQAATGIREQSRGTFDGGFLTMRLWLLVFALVITSVAVVFSVQRTNAAREKWFENQALMEQHSVVADAVIVAKACAGRAVRYSWKWGEKQLEGGGWSCNSTCPNAKLGDKVQIRFVPANPGDVRCAHDDIETILGPPNYFDPILLVILIVALLFVPFIRLSMTQEGRE